MDSNDEKYRSYIDNAPIGVFITDEHGNYLEVNHFACEQTGYTEQELLKMNITDLIPESSQSMALEHFQKIITGVSAAVEIEYLRKDKSIGYWEVSAVRLPNNTAIGFTKDTTERKRREQINSTLIKLIEFSVDHTYLELLQKFLDEAEKLTQSTIGFYHFVDDDQIHLTLQTWSTNTLNHMCDAKGQGLHYPISEAGVWVDCVRQRKPVIHNDYQALSHKQGYPEGHAPIYREIVIPVFRGEKIVAILGLGNKTTIYTEHDVLLMQELADLAWETVQVKISEEDLRKSEEQFRDLTNSITDIYFAMDQDLNYIYWNKACEDLLGFKSEDVIGESYYDFEFNKGYEWIANIYKKVIQTGQPETFEVVFPTEKLQIYFMANTYPTRDGILVSQIYCNID